MALVKYGGGIVQMSGSIAGDTHARNRFGNYVRARTKPINPNTPRQADIRAALAMLVERWSETLTAGQRAAWKLYGDSVAMKNKLGETIFLTVMNHYIRSNTVRQQNSLVLADDGPVIFELPEHDPTYRITISEATQIMTVIYDDTMDWANETGGLLHVQQGSPQNGQRNFFNGPWQYAGGQNGVTGAPPASPLPLAVTFAVAEGQRVWSQARIVRADGRLSTNFRDDVVVAA